MAHAFTKHVLFTDADGRARWRQESIALEEKAPMLFLSELMASPGVQLRLSPPGFASAFHCTGVAQWLFILQGRMEIGLQDGSTRLFSPGEAFFVADLLPDGATFDPTLHGHRSRQVGPDALVTLYVRG